jgi:feruloyl-CoA synthase
VKPRVVERDPDRLFAPAAVEIERRDANIYLRSLQPLQEYSRCVGDWLVYWAHQAPHVVFLSERDGAGEWRGVTYSQALSQVRRIGAWILRQDLSIDRPVAILSDNSIEHGLLALGAMHVGVPVVPVSPAYSLISRDFNKLKSIFQITRPGVVYVANEEQFRPALDAVRDLYPGVVIAPSATPGRVGTTPFDELLECRGESQVDAAFAGIMPDTIAKLLFTSGSTGAPKGVINTQRMLCANQQQMSQVLPFTTETPPVIVDWLPWNHTFGGNHDFNLILRAGGTLYIDAGRPTPSGFAQTIANLRDISPSIYFNVPRGYDMLIPVLRSDEDLRRTFFSRLQVIFYAAAALPQHLWEALETLAMQTTGEPIALISAWGSTETSPLATCCHFRADRAGVIGIPVPGCELKLVSRGPKLEARVRGPQVTPGYWRRDGLTAQSFDEEGFYRIGDAVRMVDETRPELGLYFDGRVSEDFKLSTGTWVNAGGLRVKALGALAPLIQDLVVAGHDRDEIGFLLFPNIVECLKLCRELPANSSADLIVAHPAVRERIRESLANLRRQGSGSSTFAGRALLMIDAPSADAGEITDKGYINQGVVLARRDVLVQRLYASTLAPSVILVAA